MQEKLMEYKGTFLGSQEHQSIHREGLVNGAESTFKRGGGSSKTKIKPYCLNN